MRLEVVVLDAPPGAASGDHGTEGTGGDAAQINPNATPGPDWEPRDPLLEPTEGPAAGGTGSCELSSGERITNAVLRGED